MSVRYAALWFHHLLPDRMMLRRPELRDTPFVLAASEHGSLRITSASKSALAQGVRVGMSVADAKAFLPRLEVMDHKPGLAEQILEALGLWCMRYTPVVSLDPPDGLLLDITGCAHLWGGEVSYAQAIVQGLQQRYGFQAKLAIASTIGAAWAWSRYGPEQSMVSSIPFEATTRTLESLPPEALRLDPLLSDKLYKLGLKSIADFLSMPANVLRRRFGEGMIQRIRQALGQEAEFLTPLKPQTPYVEHLPCLEPVRTPEVIENSIRHLLELLCKRLHGEGRGVREAVIQAYRVDGKREEMRIYTSRPSANLPHLLKLFVLKLPELEPALGLELFILEAIRVEKLDATQETFWEERKGLEDPELAELIDRLKSRARSVGVQRFLPDQHYWPERSFRDSVSLREPSSAWNLPRPRPLRLLPKPDRIEVTAPIPDYPPMLFRYKGRTHVIQRADGPERIEREWWIDQGEHRDYYYVEDEMGQRYWLFRSGHYGDPSKVQWYLHGFFA